MAPEWKEYVSARKTGLKVKWKALLQARIDHIKTLDAHEKREYFESLCHEYFDLNKTDIPIRHPDIWPGVVEVWRQDNIWNDVRRLFWLARALTSHAGGLSHAYPILNKDPDDILRRVLELDPEHVSARKILFEQHLQALDFGMHSLDSGMLIEKHVAEALIAECELLMKAEPGLKDCRSIYNIDFESYKSTFLAWHEYSGVNTDLDFDEWYRLKVHDPSDARNDPQP